MVVIVIIGILATLGLVGFQNAIRRSRDSKRMGDVRDIAIAQEQVKALNGDYVAMGTSSCTINTAISTDYRIPADPVGTAYGCTVTNIGVTTTPGSFCVWTELDGTNNGNCTSCTSTAIDASGSLDRFCVLSKNNN